MDPNEIEKDVSNVLNSQNFQTVVESLSSGQITSLSPLPSSQETTENDFAEFIEPLPKKRKMEITDEGSLEKSPSSSSPPSTQTIGEKITPPTTPVRKEISPSPLLNLEDDFSDVNDEELNNYIIS